MAERKLSERMHDRASFMDAGDANDFDAFAAEVQAMEKDRELLDRLGQFQNVYLGCQNVATTRIGYDGEHLEMEVAVAGITEDRPAGTEAYRCETMREELRDALWAAIEKYDADNPPREIPPLTFSGFLGEL